MSVLSLFVLHQYAWRRMGVVGNTDLEHMLQLKVVGQRLVTKLSVRMSSSDGICTSKRTKLVWMTASQPSTRPYSVDWSLISLLWAFSMSGLRFHCLRQPFAQRRAAILSSLSRPSLPRCLWAFANIRSIQSTVYLYQFFQARARLVFFLRNVDGRTPFRAHWRGMANPHEFIDVLALRRSQD